MFKNNEDLKIREQKNKDIFITIIFIKKEKSYFFEFINLPLNRERVLAHSILYFSETFV